MSIRVMTYVWDGYPGAGSELLAMLALADWCDDNGGNLYPSIAAVGRKIRVGEKQARRIMHIFQEQGFLTVIGNAAGGRPGATCQYRLNVAKLRELAQQKSTPPAEGSPPMEGSRTPPAKGSPTPPADVQDASRPGEGTPPTQGSQTTNEPPIEPNTKAKASPSQGFAVPDWINSSHWIVYWQHPSRKKATVEQKQLVVEKLAKWRDGGLDYAQSLEDSATNGWQGLFKPDPVGMTAQRGRKPASEGRHTAAARAIFGTGTESGVIDV